MQPINNHFSNHKSSQVSNSQNKNTTYLTSDKESDRFYKEKKPIRKKALITSNRQDGLRESY